MTDVETILHAARLMRERAEAATSGRWSVMDAGRNGHAPLIVGSDMAVAETFDKPHLSDCEHIASWHPAVALAVADSLEDAAENLGMQAPGGDLREQWDMRVHIAGMKALAIARTYLGEVSS